MASRHGCVVSTRSRSLVADAIDRLPDEFQQLLEHVPVVVSDLGHELEAYGHYLRRWDHPRRPPRPIVIFRDTLLRDISSRDALPGVLGGPVAVAA